MHQDSAVWHRSDRDRSTIPGLIDRACCRPLVGSYLLYAGQSLEDFLGGARLGREIALVVVVHGCADCLQTAALYGQLPQDLQRRIGLTLPAPDENGLQATLQSLNENTKRVARP
jgi:hypothetical protein